MSETHPSPPIGAENGDSALHEKAPSADGHIEPGCSPRELLIVAVARLLRGARHVAVGMASPIPAAASLLAAELSGGTMRVSILGSRTEQVWSDTGVEMFDCAAQGRMDVFFLGGGEIDGAGNINLVGIGDYRRPKVRWAGSFGSAYLYFTVPRVILFREEHTRRVLVPKVDFVSAPGISPDGVWRRGGPQALITSRCQFDFDRARGGFVLASVHPGSSVEAVREHTGFAFTEPDFVPETPAPDADELMALHGKVSPRLADAYPLFVATVLR
jgi:glutaconate CoA-transferase subunit B